MSKTRVLILYSWDDEISQRREKSQRASPSLQHLDFRHCFALQHPGETVTVDILERRISEGVSEYAPDIVLLHTGAAFHAAPAVFLQAFERLSHTHEDVSLGAEDRSRLNAPWLSNSPKTVEVERLFFRR